MLKAGIHGTWRTNWKPFSGTKPFRPNRSSMASTRGGTVAATAVQRIRLCARDGSPTMTAAPISGTKIMRLSVSVISLPSVRSRCRRPRPVKEHTAQHAEDDDVEVGGDGARLEVADPAA